MECTETCRVGEEGASGKSVKQWEAEETIRDPVKTVGGAGDGSSETGIPDAVVGESLGKAAGMEDAEGTDLPTGASRMRG